MKMVHQIRKYDISVFISISFCLVFSLVYATFPTKMHFADGLSYAYHMEHFPISDAWRSHHLLWLPAMHILYGAIHYFFPALRAMPFLQFLNAILGGLSVYLLIRFVHSITNNLPAGILAGAFFGFSWGMLNWATDANIYILVIALMLVVINIITGNSFLSHKNALIATLIMIVITSVHQIGFFFSFVILAAILLRSPKETKIKTLIQCALLYSSATFALYYGVYLLIRPTLAGIQKEGFMSWLTTYGHDKGYWTIFAVGFLPAQEMFNRSLFSLFFKVQDDVKAFYDQFYNESYNILFIYILFYLIILISVFWELKQILIDKSISNRPVKILLLTWFFPYFIFAHLFNASAVFYKLFFLMPILIIWTIQVLEAPPRERRVWRFLSIAILVAVAGWNISTGLVPNSKPETNPFLRDALKIKPFVHKSDLIIFARQERYLASITRYYTEANAAYILVNFRYAGSEFFSFEKANEETLKYFLSKYNRIILSDDAYKSGYQKWYFSNHFFEPPHPVFLAVSKNDLIHTGVRGKIFLLANILDKKGQQAGQTE